MKSVFSAFAVVVLSASLCLAQSIPSTPLSVRGTFGNGSSGSITDNDLSDGYVSGSDLEGEPVGLNPTGRPGSAFVQWGGPASDGLHSDALWYSSWYTGGVQAEEIFNLGVLTYRNGELTPNDGSGTVDLNLSLGFTGISIPGFNPVYVPVGLQLIGGEEERLVFTSDTLVPTNYKDAEGNIYYLEIGFSEVTASSATSFARELAVDEGTTGQSYLIGRFTTGIVPEPSAGLLGAMGLLVIFLRGRRK